MGDYDVNQAGDREKFVDLEFQSFHGRVDFKAWFEP
jgi:hypothetical protein